MTVADFTPSLFTAFLNVLNFKYKLSYDDMRGIFVSLSTSFTLTEDYSYF